MTDVRFTNSVLVHNDGSLTYTLSQSVEQYGNKLYAKLTIVARYDNEGSGDHKGALLSEITLFAQQSSTVAGGPPDRKIDVIWERSKRDEARVVRRSGLTHVDSETVSVSFDPRAVLTLLESVTAKEAWVFLSKYLGEAFAIPLVG